MDDAAQSTSKSAFSGFSALETTEIPDNDDGEEDFGGLMVD